MSKLPDKGHRDKVTKEVVPFKTLFQIAKNFEQCKKAKAIVQRAEGSIEQVNYTGTRNHPNQSKTDVKVSLVRANQSKTGSHGQSSRQGKIDICKYCAGPLHPCSICPASNKRCSNKGCGRIGRFALTCRMGAYSFAKPLKSVSTKHQAHHLDASLSEEYETDLFEVDAKLEKYAQSVYSTAENPSGPRVGCKFFSHLKLEVSDQGHDQLN